MINTLDEWYEATKEICKYLNTERKSFASDGKNCIIKVQAQHLTTPEIKLMSGMSREEIVEAILTQVKRTEYVTK